MNSKAWWMSKTLWVNALAGLAMIIQALQGAPWFSPEAQAGALAVINVLLRLITGQPLSTKPGAGVIGLILAAALLSGCTTTQQGQTMGVLKALSTVPMPPGVADPQVEAWRQWGSSIVQTYDAANPQPAATQ